MTLATQANRASAHFHRLLVFGPLLVVVSVAVLPSLAWRLWPFNPSESRLAGEWRIKSWGVVFDASRRFEIQPYRWADVRDPVVCHRGWWRCAGDRIFLILDGRDGKMGHDYDVFDGEGRSVPLIFNGEERVRISSVWLERPRADEAARRQAM